MVVPMTEENDKMSSHHAPSEQLIEYQHKNDASPSSPWFRQYEKDRLPVWAVNVRPALPSSEKGATGATPRDVLIADLMATRVPVEQPTPMTDTLERTTLNPADWIALSRTLECKNADLRGQLDRMRISTVQQELEMEGLRKQLAEARQMVLNVLKAHGMGDPLPESAWVAPMRRLKNWALKEST